MHIGFSTFWRFNSVKFKASWPWLCTVVTPVLPYPPPPASQKDLEWTWTLYQEFLRMFSRPIHMSDSSIWVQVWATKGRRWEETANFKHVELLQFFSSYVSSFMAIVSSCLNDCSSRSTANVPNSLKNITPVRKGFQISDIFIHFRRVSRLQQQQLTWSTPWAPLTCRPPRRSSWPRSP